MSNLHGGRGHGRKVHFCQEDCRLCAPLPPTAICRPAAWAPSSASARLLCTWLCNTQCGQGPEARARTARCPLPERSGQQLVLSAPTGCARLSGFLYSILQRQTCSSEASGDGVSQLRVSSRSPATRAACSVQGHCQAKLNCRQRQLQLGSRTFPSAEAAAALEACAGPVRGD